MELTEEIKQAAKGLTYISETDAPFNVIELKSTDDLIAQLKTLLHHAADTKVEIQELSYFLRNQVKVYEGASREDEQRAERFKQLEQLLTTNLKDVKVYRLGEVSIDAVITGTTEDGKTIALITKVVET